MVAFIVLSYYIIESQLVQNTRSFKTIIFEESVMLMITFENRNSSNFAISTRRRLGSHSDSENKKPDSVQGILHVTLDAEIKSIAPRMSYQSLHHVLRLWLKFELSGPFLTCLFCHPKRQPRPLTLFHVRDKLRRNIENIPW